MAMQCLQCGTEVENEDSACPTCKVLCAAKHKHYIENEMLACIYHHSSRAAQDNIKAVLSSYYRKEEIEDAKNIVLFLCEKCECLPAHVKKSRRNGDSRTAISANIGDVLECMAALDKCEDAKSIRFVTNNLSRIPPVDPEVVCNMMSIEERINKMELQLIQTQAAYKVQSELLTGIVTASASQQASFSSVVQDKAGWPSVGATGPQPQDGSSTLNSQQKAQSSQLNAGKDSQTVTVKEKKQEPSKSGESSTTSSNNTEFNAPSRSQGKKWGYKKSAVYGTKDSDAGLSGAERESDIFVFRVTKNHSEESVKKYMEEGNIQVNSIEQSSKDEVSRYRSFHIVINNKDIEKVLVPDFWPKGVGCRRWSRRSVRRDHSEAQDWNRNNRNGEVRNAHTDKKDQASA